MSYKDIDLSYAAGIIDGEGCIGIYYNRNPELIYGGSYRLTVQVGMADSAPIEFLHKIFGGYFQVVGGRKEGYKTRYMWGLGTRQAGVFLEKVLPFLLAKRQQAELGITFQRRRNPGGTKPTKEQYEEDINESNNLKLMKKHN